MVVDFLIEAIPRLAMEILARRGSGQAGPLNAYTGTALSVLLKNPKTSRESLQVLAETSSEGLRLVAEAYARFEPTAVTRKRMCRCFARCFVPKTKSFFTTLVAQHARLRGVTSRSR